MHQVGSGCLDSSWRAAMARSESRPRQQSDRQLMHDAIFITADTRCRRSGEVLVLSFEQTRPMVTPDVLEALVRALEAAEHAGSALVITTAGRHFAFGAWLDGLDAAAQGRPQELDAELHRYQQTMLRLRHAAIPTIAAVRGVAISGGCELLMHCTRVVAQADSIIGQAEASVGLIPAGGGVKEFARRAASAAEPARFIADAFTTLAAATVARSAMQARQLGFLTPADVVTEDDPLPAAIEVGRNLQSAGHVPPARNPTFAVAGTRVEQELCASQAKLLADGQLTEHQFVVNCRLAKVLCGAEGPAELRTEADLFALERSQFLALAQMPLTQARIAHLRSTGQVLVN